MCAHGRGLSVERSGEIDCLGADRRGSGRVLAQVVQDRALRPRRDDRIRHALDPDPGAPAVTAVTLAERLERIDLVGTGVLAEAEEDHPCGLRHGRIIPGSDPFRGQTPAVAARRTSTTRVWSSRSICVKKGSAIVRLAVSSATGQRPSPKPNRSRMYGWRWIQGTYSAVPMPSRRRVSMTAERSSGPSSLTT